MIKIENIETAGWQPALRGMRNPMNSWDKADSHWEWGKEKYCIGTDDHKLAMQLRKGGSDDRKYMRMILVWCDITAPLYWWKEFDTYRMGVEKNSCSTMHKITEKKLTLEDFSTDKMVDNIESKDGSELLASPIEDLECMIDTLNLARSRYLTTKLKPYWWVLIQALPSSYNQRRTVMMSYEALANMYHARKYHKLDEWREFCKWVETLPYSELITGEGAK